MTLHISDKEIKDYFNKIIIPSFLPLVESTIVAVIWDISGELVVATNRYAEKFGFKNWEEMKGRNIHNPQAQEFPILNSSSIENTQYALDIIQQIVNLRERVFVEKMPVSAVIIHPFTRVFSTTIIIYQTPVFHYSGEIVGAQMTITDFNMFGVNDYLSGYQDKALDVPSIIKKSDELKIPLSRRQHEILFLLTIGLSQREAAAILNISRSSIAKTLTESICPKFDIYDANTNTLIEKARKMNIHKFIPSSLCKPWVIVLGEMHAE
ncbi:helix-turn-helix transcriptional regulator [Aquella oligotrophica]|uniref:Uncharacterized protein n=1 Tax=Aquella oligotrophica TaxID=2067065 RepID=A0A2I7N3Q7_9NEIS|nr:hypothetical protein [Aquella oligotrophica]AUR51091.1 hypothetical protein CUN60_01800 [Aquella oligotrophica]